MKIGVLALQGDFIEHQHTLERLGCEVVQVRRHEPRHDSVRRMRDRSRADDCSASHPAGGPGDAGARLDD